MRSGGTWGVVSCGTSVMLLVFGVSRDGHIAVVAVRAIALIGGGVVGHSDLRDKVRVTGLG